MGSGGEGWWLPSFRLIFVTAQVKHLPQLSPGKHTGARGARVTWQQSSRNFVNSENS